MNFVKMSLYMCSAILGVFFVTPAFSQENDAPKEKPEKVYKNPFSSLQKQRASNQIRLVKLIANATPKPGTKTKRDPRDSKSVIAMNKKIASINSRILKLYLRKLSGYTPKIMRYKKKILELEDRLKMTSAQGKTLASIAKMEGVIAEMKEEFVASIVAFEPIPHPLLLDPAYRDKHPWLGDLAD